MAKFLCLKHTYECNLKCWYCSTCGKGSIPSEDVRLLYEKYAPEAMLLIGGEPMTLPVSYFLSLLDSGVKFSMQTNLTLYTPAWNPVFLHYNFQGLSVSGDKHRTIEEFLEVYLSVSVLLRYKPMVLLVFDSKDYAVSLDKALLWWSLSMEHNFPLRFNYLTPAGRAAGQESRLLSVSDAFLIYLYLLKPWSDASYPEVEPLTSIMEYFLTTRSKCPFVAKCFLHCNILTIEVDKSVYPCPTLGDMRGSKSDLYVDLPSICLTCTYFPICRGCYVRSWEVSRMEDKAYCTRAYSLFSKIEELSEDWKHAKSSGALCKAY